jgi:phage shock protein C
MKHLYRSEHDRVIAGVCGGLALYFDRDPLLFRLLFLLLTLTWGIGVTLYLLLWLVLPSAQQEYAQQEQVMRENAQEMGARARELATEARKSYARARRTGSRDDTLIILGAMLVGFGLLLLFRNIGLLVWVRYLWPVALVALGIAILANNLKED